VPEPESPCRVRTLDHLVLTVADIPETIQFYTKILGMRGTRFAVADGSERWALTFGKSKINLHQKGREFDPKSADPTPGSADLCFLTDAPIEAWSRHLTTQGVVIEDGPVSRSGAAGPILSLYIRDPDGNLIEISVPKGP